MKLLIIASLFGEFIYNLFLVLTIAGYNENISKNSIEGKDTHCVKNKPFSKAVLR